MKKYIYTILIFCAVMLLPKPSLAYITFHTTNPESSTTITGFCMTDTHPHSKDIPIVQWDTFFHLRAYYTDTGELASFTNPSAYDTDPSVGCLPLGSISVGRSIRIWVSENQTFVPVSRGWGSEYTGVDPCDNQFHTLNESQCVRILNYGRGGFLATLFPLRLQDSIGTYIVGSSTNAVTSSIGSSDVAIEQVSQSAVAFMGAQTILVIGSGLGMLTFLFPYILALVMIAGIVYAIYTYMTSSYLRH
jgi:hypothetical protein